MDLNLITMLFTISALVSLLISIAVLYKAWELHDLGDVPKIVVILAPFGAFFTLMFGLMIFFWVLRYMWFGWVSILGVR